MILIHSRRQNNNSKQVLGYTAAVSSRLRRRLMFRLFHNAVHDLCTRSLACSTFLHVPCTYSRRAHEQVLRRRRRQTFVTYPHQTGVGGVRYPENIYPVDRGRARCAIRARLLGARPQEGEMVLRVFQLLPSSIHTTSYILPVYTYTYNTFALVPKGGISQLHISHLSTHTCMLRQERATMSYVHEL